MRRLWFSIYDFSFNYPGNEPAFIPAENLPWAEELASNYKNIKLELQEYLSLHKLDSYFNTSMVNNKDSWKTIALKTWSVELFKNQKQFPFTTSMINKYPNIVSASFNLLEPGAKILPHCGDTNAIYRCHLGLDIPSGLPEVGFKVKNELREWENGKWIVFMDAYKHEAWNNSDKPRYIFLIDIMRDEYADKKKLVCSTVLSSLFLQKRAEVFKFLLTSKPVMIKTLAHLMQPLSWISISLINTFKIY
jgi:aspartyl/asparaginyl beta-hydroxylase (cupin superfamily)